jgi:hypothetical protein
MKHFLYTKLVNMRTRHSLEKDQKKKSELLKQILRLEKQIW